MFQENNNLNLDPTQKTQISNRFMNVKYTVQDLIFTLVSSLRKGESTKTMNFWRVKNNFILSIRDLPWREPNYLRKKYRKSLDVLDQFNDSEAIGERTKNLKQLYGEHTAEPNPYRSCFKNLAMESATHIQLLKKLIVLKQNF